MATISLDLARTLGAVDPRIYSGFIEHLGRCIYGGVFDEGSPLSDERGFRRDTLAAARLLRMPLLRWPGGNFVSGYHWRDGVGPVEQRPRRLELAWHDEESNRFGTDEFMAYCEALGTAPYICVNMGTGTADEAQGWVEYCNGTGNTAYAQLRRQHGHAEPYGVTYWGLGNEMYGEWQLGRLDAQEYVKKAAEYAKMMQWTDPTIQLVSCGLSGWSDWDRVVVEGLAKRVRYHSIHIYTGSADYYTNVFQPHVAEFALRSATALIERVRFEQSIAHPITVAYDEWNVWYREREHGLEERYTLADALAVATYLNIFVRQAQSLGMANLAQLVNVIAPIVTSPDGHFLQAIYHPLRLYAEYMQGTALDVAVASDMHTGALTTAGDFTAARQAQLGPFALLDAAATFDEGRRSLTLAVVNRDRDRAHEGRITLAEGAFVAEGEVYEVNGEDVEVSNSFARPDAVTARSRQETLALDAEGRRLTYQFPAHSVTLLRLRLA